MSQSLLVGKYLAVTSETGYFISVLDNKLITIEATAETTKIYRINHVTNIYYNKKLTENNRFGKKTFVSNKKCHIYMYLHIRIP